MECVASIKYIKPTRDCMPDIFVTETKTEGSLLDQWEEMKQACLLCIVGIYMAKKQVENM